MEPVGKAEDIIATLKEQLLLQQQHTDFILQHALQAINDANEALFQERESHEQSKAELARLQQLVSTIQPGLQRLTQRLRVRPCAAQQHVAFGFILLPVFCQVTAVVQSCTFLPHHAIPFRMTSPSLHLRSPPCHQRLLLLVTAPARVSQWCSRLQSMQWLLLQAPRQGQHRMLTPSLLWILPAGLSASLQSLVRLCTAASHGRSTCWSGVLW